MGVPNVDSANRFAQDLPHLSEGGLGPLRIVRILKVRVSGPRQSRFEKLVKKSQNNSAYFAGRTVLVQIQHHLKIGGHRDVAFARDRLSEIIPTA